MSAHFGIVRFDGGSVDLSDLRAMGSALARRGPDGEFYWHSGPAGLGHRALNNTPQATGEKQPWEDPVSGLVITADARIDNRAELRRACCPESAANVGDGQLIVAAYRKWGDQCLQHLLGDFAFVIWNPATREVFCGRDPLGVKPFYYYLDDGYFAFASGQEGIKALPWFPAEINRVRVVDYLYGSLERIDKTSTFYLNLHRHPPGTSLSIDAQGRSRSGLGWQFSTGDTLSLGSQDAYNSAFIDQFSVAVNRHLHATGDVGVALSGGIDSASIVAIARGQLQHEQRLHSFSAISPTDVDCAETQRLKDVVAQGGVTGHFLEQAQAPALEQSWSLLNDSCEPFDALMSFYALCCQSASSMGVRVLLDGVDDVIFDNIDEYPAYLFRYGQPLSAWREINARSLRTAGGLTRRGLLRNNMETLLGTRCVRNLRRLRRGREGPTLEQVLRGTLINPALAQEIDLPARRRELEDTWPARMLPSLAEANLADITHPFLTVALERYDRVASHFSIEVRHPYLDRDLVQFALKLPWQQRNYQGWTKYLLRQSMQGYLPPASMQQVDNAHVGWAFTQARLAGWKERLGDLLLGDLSDVDWALDTAAVRACTLRYLSGRFEPLDEALLWKALTLTLWLRRECA